MKKLKALLDLVVFKHSIFALPFLLVSMMSSAKLSTGSAWFGWQALVLGLLCAVAARNFAMATNRLMDEDIDRANPRTASRPNIKGELGRGAVWVFILVNALIFIIASGLINALALKLALPILLILAFYSACKRFWAGAHLVLGLGLGLAPVAGSVVVSETISLMSVLLGLGVLFWTAGFDLLYALQDLDFDRRVGLHSVPARFGPEAALFISALCQGLAGLFWLLFYWAAPLGGLALVGIIICGGLLCWQQVIVRRNFAKIERAFFSLNAYLSVIFFAFVWVDLLWA